MDKFSKFLSALVAAFVILLAWNTVSADTEQYSEGNAINMTRACIPKDGHTTQLSISGTSAGSGVLGQRRVFSIICTTAVYWETGDTANPTADSSSDYLPSDTLLYWATGEGDQSRYVAAVQVSASGTCFIHECE